MLFHTWIFLVFFLVTYPVYLRVKSTRLQDPWLLIVSYVFYGWWSPFYLVLILVSTAIDYFAVIGMSRTRRRGLWLVVSLTSNLLLLGSFKYGDFLAENLSALLRAVHIPLAFGPPGLLLPVGISFYTFQSMSYTIDYYRGHIPREPSFIRFAAFVSLFPQLVAGPIERASHLLPQLRQPDRITVTHVTDGLSLFVLGLFKKVALADYLGLYVDRIYDAPAAHEGPALLMATFAFAWQIYFDFSGYTDMARGIARAMGFDLMRNFDSPYLATGLGDFWRRWHISLSTWFRDYVYIPLGGNRGGTLATYRNLVLTMLLAGLWHGAAWTFVIWGAMHAAGRVLTRELERTWLYRDVVPTIVKQLLVFAFVLLTWVFFRAHSLADAGLILSRIFQPRWVDPGFPALALALILAVWIYQYMRESGAASPQPSSTGPQVPDQVPVAAKAAPKRTAPEWVAAGRAAARRAAAVAMLLYLALVPTPQDQPFIYFQF